MEGEGSLPHSQVPATCPYPEPDQSIPCPTSHFLKIHLNISLPSTPGSSKWSQMRDIRLHLFLYVFIMAQPDCFSKKPKHVASYSKQEVCLFANITTRRHTEEVLPIGSDVIYHTDVKATVTGIHQAVADIGVPEHRSCDVTVRRCRCRFAQGRGEVRFDVLKPCGAWSLFLTVCS
jgi:hypothetical protein